MTFSIVARDPEDGSLGVAVQSAWFAVGHIVPWVNAGVGVVVTQAFVNPTYGARGLTLMRNGLSATRSLDALLEIDDGRDSRQVAMIDGNGDVAVHTGVSCMHVAEHVTRGQVSCQGNILHSTGTCEAMLQAYETTDGEMVNRLIAAMVAAESSGGDARGRQSAALLVVAGQGQRDLYADRLFDIRIDDHPDPVGELQRVAGVQRAYRLLNLAGDCFVERDFEAAANLALGAAAILPGDVNVVVIGVMALLVLDRRAEACELADMRHDTSIDWGEMALRIAGSFDMPDLLDTNEIVAIMRRPMLSPAEA